MFPKTIVILLFELQEFKKYISMNVCTIYLKQHSKLSDLVPLLSYCNIGTSVMVLYSCNRRLFILEIVRAIYADDIPGVYVM